MIEVLEGLNAEQKEAVLHIEGPCMVLAGAGSGKTRVLTRRISYLISKGVPSESILAITFTNKAAQEMRSRVAQLIPDYSGQWVQTFHAACYKILRMDIGQLGFDKNFSILDETESKTLIKEILKEERDYETKPDEVLWFIKQAKNSLMDPDVYFSNLGQSPLKRDLYQRVFRIYRARMKEYNALDFEDLIVLCIQLFREYPDTLAKYQRWFKYILIDEYQDTNYAQYMWAKMLASNHHNLFVVGDPDQSIYSWRGAEPYNVTRFLKDYSDAKMVKLLTNYRSSQNIITAANAVIKNNVDREEKNLRTPNDAGDVITYFCAGDSYQEAQFVAETLNQLCKEQNRTYNDCAIFYRTHAQSRLIEEALVRKYIPYKIVGAHRFYERKEIKDIVAYLKLISNGNDRLSFRRVINVPRRGIGDKSLEKLEAEAALNGISVTEVLKHASDITGITKKAAEKLENFYGMLQFLSSLNEGGSPLREILDQLLDLSGYIEDLQQTNPAEAQARMDNILELRSLAVQFEKDGGEGLEGFLAQIALVQDTDDVDYAESVLLMTYHGAKGLEFPVVFMTGMEEGLFPHSRSGDMGEELAEERRLCYVGMTRAM
ncbi:MAG: UvrD-helicase domain-containing protein, partial [Bacillota bacterium]|nr:UvrD-helicase domain-containing protein [Bacillota bacterium]